MKIERVVSFKLISDSSLYVEFADGFSGVFNLKEHLEFTRTIEKELLNPELFQRAELNMDFGCIEWPNGFDISPEYLRKAIAA